MSREVWITWIQDYFLQPTDLGRSSVLIRNGYLSCNEVGKALILLVFH